MAFAPRLNDKATHGKVWGFIGTDQYLVKGIFAGRDFFDGDTVK
jgi:hypothetical protein